MTDHRSEQDNVQCRECGLEILATARICGYCESYQSHWRNELRYFANIAGIFTVIGTAAFFSITLAPSMRQSLFWKDHIEVVKVDGHVVTVANAGDGNVFLFEVVLEGPDPQGLSLEVNDTLPAGAVLQVDGNRSFHLDSDDGFAAGEQFDARVLSDTDPLWGRALAEATWAYETTTEAGLSDMSCFQLVPLSTGGNYWNRLVRMRGEQPTTISVGGRVRGFSLGRGEAFESPFTAEALIIHWFQRTGPGERHWQTDEPLEEGRLRCELY